MGLIPIEPRSVTKTLVWKGLTRLRNLGIIPRASRKARSQTANRMTTPGRSVNHRAVASASFSVEATLFTDTVFEVAAAIDAAVSAGRAEGPGTETDRAARLFMLLPRPLVRLLLWTLRALDYHGLMPRVLHRASPFHTSAFVTDLGSLGIRPIYHHLYEFGTTSVFLAFGHKERRLALGEDGKVAERKVVGLKAVNDERICDGHYYASAFKLFLGLFRHLEPLGVAPGTVIEDVE